MLRLDIPKLGVGKVEPGRTITLRDLLSGEERTVHEVSGSKTLARRDALLACIVDYDGISLLCGSHPCPLPPLEAAEVVENRIRRQSVPPRLHNTDGDKFLLTVDHFEFEPGARAEMENA